jgi:predicted ArsR family transcriptional regulator
VSDVDDQRWRRVASLVDPARRRVYELLDRTGPTTRDRLAADLGLGRTLVTHHLARLEQDGLVRSQQEAPTGRAGRPAVLFEVAARPELPGRRYELLAHLLAASGPDPAHLLAVARAHGRAAVPPTGSTGRRARTALADLGFAPRLSRGTLQSTCCPFLAVAAEQPEVACTLARGLAEGVAEALPGSAVEPVENERCCVRLRLAAC